MNIYQGRRHLVPGLAGVGGGLRPCGGSAAGLLG
jgi:hypothetical protein